MEEIEKNKNNPSDYIRFYLDLLEEYGENSVLSLKEFDSITCEASFSNPSKVLYYLLRHSMVVPSEEGEVMLRNLSPTDTAFHLLSEDAQNVICEFILNKNQRDSKISRV